MLLTVIRWMRLQFRHRMQRGAALSILLTFSVPVQAGPQEPRVPILPLLARLTLDDHPSVRGQRAQRQAAQAGVEQARWQFYPTPTINVEQASAGSQDAAYAGDGRVATLGVRQPLWTGGRLTASLGKAQAQEQANAAGLDEARQQLALRVIQAYSEALAAHLKVQAYERSRDSHAQLFDQVARRVSEGYSAQSDSALAQSRLESVYAELVTSIAQRDSALEKLRQLSGRPVSARSLDSAQHDLAPSLYTNDVTVLLNDAEARSPGLMRLAAMARIAELDIDVARAGRWPEIYLRAERQYGSFIQPNSAPHTRVFVGLNSNFGAGLSVQSAVTAAAARAEAALEDTAAYRRTVEEQVRSDLALENASAQRRSRLVDALRTSDDVSQSWSRQFLAGRKQWQDVMNAARELAQTDTQVADATATLEITRWRLLVYCRGVDAMLALASP